MFCSCIAIQLKSAFYAKSLKMQYRDYLDILKRHIFFSRIELTAHMCLEAIQGYNGVCAQCPPDPLHVKQHWAKIS